MMNFFGMYKDINAIKNFGIKESLLGYNNIIKNDNVHLNLGINWLNKSHQIVNKKGFSAGYSLSEKKWRELYPETTGYILESIIKYNLNSNLNQKFDVEKIKDWLISIQGENGFFPGGVGIHGKPSVFNTGQILIGLIEYFKYVDQNKVVRNSILNASNWLVSVQDRDGYWLKYSYNNIPHAYYTRVSYPLIAAGRLFGIQKFIASGKQHIQWALDLQKNNGFFNYMGFTKENHITPFTHTIAYTLRGFLEAYLLLDEDEIISKIKISLEKLLRIYEIKKKLYGQYDMQWKPATNYLCLTGNSQLAIVFMKYFELSNDARFLNAALKLIDDVKAKQIISHKDSNVIGGIPGSYPIFGNYMRYYLPNWSVKFFLDALIEKNNILKRIVK